MFVLRDVRCALRLLARTPGSTLLTVLVLASGLGLGTFTFSFLHTAMIRPIPLARGDRVDETRIAGVMPEGFGFPVAAEATTILRRAIAARTKPGEPAPGAAVLVESFPAPRSAISPCSRSPRLFVAADDRSQAPVALISQSLAVRHWPGRSPVGERLRLASLGDPAQWRTIAGVVGDLPFGSPIARERSTDAIRVPLPQSTATEAAVIVRHRATEGAAREALCQVLGEADPALTPRYVHRAAEVLRQAGFITIALAKLFGACFAFALLLAVAGTYGLMSTAIGQRTREIGLSAAIVAIVLGATWVPIRKALRTPLRTALLRERPGPRWSAVRALVLTPPSAAARRLRSPRTRRP